MNSPKRLLVVLSTFFFLFIFFCSQALAGLVIERIRYQGTAPQKTGGERIVTYFQDNKVKTVQKDSTYTVIDLATGTMTVVDPKKKEYSVTSIDEMVSQMQKGMDRLKKQLAGMSPQQRAMMEKMMGFSQGPSAKLVLKKVGGSKKIAGYEADHYVITQNGKKIGEYWVSKALRDKMLKEIDEKKIEKLEKAMNTISSQLNVFGNSSLTELMDLEQRLQKKGEIVKQIHYPSSINMNKKGSLQEVVSVREEKIPASAFTIPKGFKKKSANPQG